MLHTKSGILGTNTDDKHVERDLVLIRITLDIRVVADVDDLLLVVDLGGLGFVVCDASLLVAQKVANGLHDGAVLNGADCARGKERGEEEVVAGRDDDDIVVLGVELLQQGDGTPASTYRRLEVRSQRRGSHSSALTQHDERLLARVRRGLVGRVACLVNAICDPAKTSEGGEISESPCPAQDTEPPDGLWRGTR